MSRLTLEQEISSEEIINNSLDIYKREVNLTKKGHNYIGLCPLHGEKTPSFNVSCNHPYIFKCFGCGKSGNIITFLKERYNTDYEGVLNYIKNNNFILAPIQQIATIKKEEKKELIVDWVVQKFEQKHKDYWDKYEVPESFLNENGVFALKSYAINKKVIPIHESTAAFVYEHPNGGCKILQIGEKVDKKWTNTIKNNELWGVPEGRCKQLWVQKSVKDMIVSKYHFQFCTLAIQSESHIIIDNNIEKLKSISDDIVLFWGNDPQSVKECTIAQKKYNLKYFNIPKYMYRHGVVDLADCVESYGVRRVEKELQKKGFL